MGPAPRLQDCCSHWPAMDRWSIAGDPRENERKGRDASFFLPRPPLTPPEKQCHVSRCWPRTEKCLGCREGGTRQGQRRPGVSKVGTCCKLDPLKEHPQLIQYRLGSSAFSPLVGVYFSPGPSIFHDVWRRRVPQNLGDRARRRWFAPRFCPQAPIHADVRFRRWTSAPESQGRPRDTP